MSDSDRLTSERLVLRPLRLKDAPRLQEIASDKRVSAMTASIPHPYPDDAALNFIHRAEGLKGINARKFAITLLQSGDLIGLIGFAGNAREAEISYLIAPSHWHCGYATEAAKSLLGHLADCGKQRIVATAMGRNSGSIRVLEKLGFAKVWERQMDIPLRGGTYLVGGWELSLIGTRHVTLRQASDPKPDPRD